MGDKKPQPKQNPKPNPYSWVTKDTLKQLEEGGITDPQAQKNVLWVIQAETGGIPKRENMNYSSGKRIAQVFGKNALFKGLTQEQAAKKAEDMGLVNNPRALANAVYNGRMGNVEPDDGWKYRAGAGAGITGKNNYEAIFERLGMPKDTDPDVLTKDPKLAMRANIAFFQMNSKGKDLRDINQVNKIIRSAVPFEERLKNNPMPTDEILKSIKNAPEEPKSFLYKEPTFGIPMIYKDPSGMPSFDTRPSDA